MPRLLPKDKLLWMPATYTSPMISVEQSMVRCKSLEVMGKCPRDLPVQQGSPGTGMLAGGAHLAP
eukprot:scaffold1061_cov213-Prasinococcus_capsulatus_cf.AAC.9